MTQMNSLITFSTHAPGYGRIQNGTAVNKMKEYMKTVGGCGDLLRECEKERTLPEGNKICSDAWTTCVSLGSNLIAGLTMKFIVGIHRSPGSSWDSFDNGSQEVTNRSSVFIKQLSKLPQK